MPGTVLLLAASPVGKGCLVDAASVLPVLAAVPPAVLAGTDTANVVELADPLEPQAVLTRLRAAAAAPGPLTVFVTGQLQLDRKQRLPHLALARTTPSTVRYTGFPWHWFREELRLRSAGTTTLLLDLHADAETWAWLRGRGLECGPGVAVYGRVAPPVGRRKVAAPTYMKASRPCCGAEGGRGWSSCISWRWPGSRERARWGTWCCGVAVRAPVVAPLWVSPPRPLPTLSPGAPPPALRFVLNGLVLKCRTGWRTTRTPGSRRPSRPVITPAPTRSPPVGSRSPSSRTGRGRRRSCTGPRCGRTWRCSRGTPSAAAVPGWRSRRRGWQRGSRPTRRRWRRPWTGPTTSGGASRTGTGPVISARRWRICAAGSRAVGRAPWTTSASSSASFRRRAERPSPEPATLARYFPTRSAPVDSRGASVAWAGTALAAAIRAAAAVTAAATALAYLQEGRP